jgi:hypothetical protein
MTRSPLPIGQRRAYAATSDQVHRFNRAALDYGWQYRLPEAFAGLLSPGQMHVVTPMFEGKPSAAAHLGCYVWLRELGRRERRLVPLDVAVAELADLPLLTPGQLHGLVATLFHYLPVEGALPDL